jgi:hypothetical protein
MHQFRLQSQGLSPSDRLWDGIESSITNYLIGIVSLGDLWYLCLRIHGIRHPTKTSLEGLKV